MDESIEIRVLRVLCQGTPEGPVKDIGESLLRDYHWRSATHRTLWDALRTIPSEDINVLRQLLPAQLTRLGFPDEEWEQLFVPQTLSKEEAVAFMRRMRDNSA